MRRRPRRDRGADHAHLDRTTGICASIYTSSLPLVVEREVWQLYRDFEAALYAAL